MYTTSVNVFLWRGNIPIDLSKVNKEFPTRVNQTHTWPFFPDNNFKLNVVFNSFYLKLEETFQVIQVQMRSNISSMYMYLQMHWHLDAL